MLHSSWRIRAYRYYKCKQDYRGVWEVYKECQANLNKCVKDIGYRSPLEFLESDLKEVRKKFNIGEVPLYEAFEKRYERF